MLKWRVLTAVALGPAFLAAILLLPPSPLAVLFALIVLLGAWEWIRLVQMPTATGLVFLGGLVVLFGLGWWYLRAELTVVPLFVLALLWWVGAMVWLHRFAAGGSWRPGGVTSFLIGICLLWPVWFALVYLHSLPDGRWWIIILCLLVWGADIGAYFAGRAFGKRKLAVNISPNKTWEGVTGGVVLALIAAALLYSVVKPQGPIFSWFLIVALGTVAISVIGDLFESMIKRLYGAKDSGTLLPGHGGMLDRIDSMTAAGPVFASGVMLWWLLA